MNADIREIITAGSSGKSEDDSEADVFEVDIFLVEGCSFCLMEEMRVLR